MVTRPVGRPALAAAQKRTVAVTLRFSAEEIKLNESQLFGRHEPVRGDIF